MKIDASLKIGIIGLGYVGLPLAVEFGRRFKTFGFDIDPLRIKSLQNLNDETNELDRSELSSADKLLYTNNIHELGNCSTYIITVPTPINKYNEPDLTPILKATEMVASVAKKGDVIIFESTVYPGCIEEDCVPVLEKISGLTFNTDFFCGYSPERINPGDKTHRLKDIVKITSGSNQNTANYVDSLYKEIISAGTYKASSIKVAEAAKVIENTQRDVNIALINEFSIIFNNLDLDTNEILDAACTKWNFMNFRPGLVGGHCIGVDPYYLTHKSIKEGYRPELVLSGRRLNDSMHKYVAQQILKILEKSSVHPNDSKGLVLGLTFKENCPDLRNSKVFDLIADLQKFSKEIHVYDPWVNDLDQDINLLSSLDNIKNQYDYVVLAVSHKCFEDINPEKIRQLCKDVYFIYDLKNFYEKEKNIFRL